MSGKRAITGGNLASRLKRLRLELFCHVAHPPLRTNGQKVQGKSVPPIFPVLFARLFLGVDALRGKITQASAALACWRGFHQLSPSSQTCSSRAEVAPSVTPSDGAWRSTCLALSISLVISGRKCCFLGRFEPAAG